MGGAPPEAENFPGNLPKSVMLKLKILITFKNCMNFFHGFGQKYKNNWKLSPGMGVRRVEPHDASEFLWFFPKFSSCHFNFSLKSADWPPKTKHNNSVLAA